MESADRVFRRNPAHGDGITAARPRPIFTELPDAALLACKEPSRWYHMRRRLSRQAMSGRCEMQVLYGHGQAARSPRPAGLHPGGIAAARLFAGGRCERMGGARIQAASAGMSADERVTPLAGKIQIPILHAAAPTARQAEQQVERPQGQDPTVD